MKLAIVIAFGALALAGPVLAQPPSDHPSGVSIPTPADRAISPGPPVSQEVLDQIRGAAQQMNLACAADAQTLCANKTPRAMNRCLDYHRLRLSKPCKNAMDQLRLAWVDAP